MRFRVLGGLEVIDQDRPIDTLSPKQRAILAVLLLELDRVVSVDRLIDIVWGDASDTALASLHSQVSRLRTMLEPGRLPRQPATVLLTQPPGYRLAVARADVDACRFEDDVARGLSLSADGEIEEAVVVLRAALGSWGGPLLPEFGDQPFALASAERLAHVRLAALEAVADAHLHLGEHDDAVTVLESEARQHPARERTQWLLALALYRSDRQTEGLRVIDRCRRALLDSSGLNLGTELRELESAMLAQDPALIRPQRPTPRSALAAEPDAAAPTMDPPTPSRRNRIVGRGPELRSLIESLDDAAAGHGGFAVIVGEPGIGKTRLAESLVEHAAERDVLTAWARCPENRSAPPFWPLTQLGEQLRAAGFTELQVRELDRQTTEAAPSERFGFYRAVLDAVATIDQPMLLVIDDLQWADPDSLRLLEHTASELRSTRTLLVATVRPVAEDANPALVDCLAEITRAHGSLQLPLAGLSPDDVAAWLDTHHDVVVPREVAALVHERTAGNPLFIKEVVELLAAEGRLDSADAAREARAIPPGVKSVIRRRVSRLPRHTQQLLPVAAVLGRTVDIDVLAAVTGSDAGTVLTSLEPAVDQGLLIELHGDLAFSHVLVADALADEVNAIRRATFHAAAARALATTGGPDFGLRAAAVAHHAFEGILAGTGDLAIDASARAATLAAEQFAHEDAAAHWARAADALARCRPSDVATRINALIASADALLDADMVLAAKAPIVAAVGAAAAVGSTADMTRAALLVNHEHVWANEPYGVVDADIVRSLERTLAAGVDTDERALLLGALAAELAFADRERHLDTCAAAERAARESGNPTTLAVVLNSITIPCRPSQIADRERWAHEILDLAGTGELDADQLFAAHYHLAETCMERIDFDGAAGALAAARRTIETMHSDRLRSQLMSFEGALALARGRDDDAQRLAHASHELHRRGRRYDATALQLANDAGYAIDRGDLTELIPIATATADASPYGRVVAETMAFAMLELGRPDVATELVARYGASSEFPDDYMSLCCISAAVHVRVELGDAAGADAAARALVEFPHRWAGAGTTPLSMGPTDLALARHAAFVGQHELALTRFTAAQTATASSGAEPWEARCLVHHGAFLRELGRVDEGNDALRRADVLARRHGLTYVARRLQHLGD